MRSAARQHDGGGWADADTVTTQRPVDEFQSGRQRIDGSLSAAPEMPDCRSCIHGPLQVQGRHARCLSPIVETDSKVMPRCVLVGRAGPRLPSPRRPFVWPKPFRRCAKTFVPPAHMPLHPLLYQHPLQQGQLSMLELDAHEHKEQDSNGAGRQAARPCLVIMAAHSSSSLSSSIK